MTAFAYEVHDHLLDNEDADPESDEVQAVPVCCFSLPLACASQWHCLWRVPYNGTASACSSIPLVCSLTCSALVALILHAL